MRRALTITCFALGACSPDATPPTDVPADVADPPVDTLELPPESSPDTRPGPTWVGMRRLAVPEIVASLEDALGVDALDDVVFPEEPVAWSFDHLAETSVVSDVLISSLDDAAEDVAAAWLQANRGETVWSTAIWSAGDPHGCAQEDPWTNDRFWWISWIREPITIPFDVPETGTWLLSLDYFHRVALLGAQGLELTWTVDGQPAHSVTIQGPEIPAKLEVALELEAGPHTVTLTLPDGMTVQEDAQYQGDTGYCITAEAIAYGDLSLVGPRSEAPTAPPCHPSQQADCVSEALRTTGERLWRRPLVDDELSRLTEVVETAMAETRGTFDEGMAWAVHAMVLSPYFLMRPEAADEALDIPHPVGPWELATRLSMLVWGSIPDETLRACARAETLGQPEGDCSLLSQLDRMLDDPRAANLSARFVGQWLGIRDVPNQTSPSGVELSDLGHDMVAETYDVFQTYIHDPTRPLTEFVAAPFSWLTPALASHYGIELGSTAPSFQITWGDGDRLGVLGHASMLVATSTPERTNPSRRGAWVLERLLCSPIGAPPPDIPELELDDGEDVATALARHTQDPACSGCHGRLDPLGQALERFDEAGRVVSDASEGPFTLDDGTTLTGPADIARWVSQHPDHARCVTQTLATYSLGHHIGAAEHQQTEDWMARGSTLGGSWRALLQSIITSPSFTHRVDEPTEGTQPVEVTP